MAEVDGEVVGFASLSPFRDRPAYNSTVENSVYVRADQRGTGVGAALLRSWWRWPASTASTPSSPASSAGTTRRSRCTSRLGFEEVGTEREVGRKFGKWLDVMVMQRLL